MILTKIRKKGSPKFSLGGSTIVHTEAFSSSSAWHCLSEFLFWGWSLWWWWWWWWLRSLWSTSAMVDTEALTTASEDDCHYDASKWWQQWCSQLWCSWLWCSWLWCLWCWCFNWPMITVTTILFSHSFHSSSSSASTSWYSFDSLSVLMMIFLWYDDEATLAEVVLSAINTQHLYIECVAQVWFEVSCVDQIYHFKCHS